MYYITMAFDTEEVVDKAMSLLDGYLDHRYMTLTNKISDPGGIAGALQGKPDRVSIILNLYDEDGTNIVTLMGSTHLQFVGMTVLPTESEPGVLSEA